VPMTWDALLRGMDWLAERIDPGAPVDGDRREHRRGARLWTPPAHLTGRALARHAERTLARWEHALARPGDAPGLRLWGPCGLRGWQEGAHILLLGATGAGKTTLLRHYLAEVVARGDRALVFDPKADLTSWLLDEHRDRTVLLAPWDRRSVAWQLSRDVDTMPACDEAARTLIPDVPDARDPYWYVAPQAILRGVMQYLVMRQQQRGTGTPWSYADVWRIIAAGPEQALRAIAQTPSGGLVGEIIAGGKGARTRARDVWSTIAARLTWLEYLSYAWPQVADGWSVRRWAAGEGPQVLLLPVSPDYRATAEAVARLAVETLARYMLAQPDDPDKRVWVFADEFSALGELRAVAELLLRARSKGAAVVAALQDIGSIRRAWGRDQAASIINAFSALVVLRLNDPELAEWAARALGRREVVERMRSRSSHSSGDSGESSGHSEHVREEYVVMPSELTQLPVLSGYVRVTGWPAVVQLGWERWAEERRPSSAPVVEPADWVVRGPLAAPHPTAPVAPGDGGLGREEREERRPPRRFDMSR
jgi:type IV secretory pathway TraG/TraD family ATPase VirD4